MQKYSCKKMQLPETVLSGLCQRHTTWDRNLPTIAIVILLDLKAKKSSKK